MKPPDLFAEHLGEVALIGHQPGRRPGGLRPLPSRNKVPGHIYVLESPYGYKIGKTVNLTERTRLFAVKLPFQNSLVHHFHTEDYTAAERALHIQYADKRLEGEWFNLTAGDIRDIRAVHPV